jgi:hypothetical protein
VVRPSSLDRVCESAAEEVGKYEEGEGEEWWEEENSASPP